MYPYNHSRLYSSSYYVQISENGLEARVRTLAVGLGKVKATLRSTLSPEGEEVEITPLVKVDSVTKSIQKTVCGSDLVVSMILWSRKAVYFMDALKCSHLCFVIQGVTEFEIYEEILVTPSSTFLPWDSLHPHSLQYHLNYRVRPLSFDQSICPSLDSLSRSPSLIARKKQPLLSWFLGQMPHLLFLEIFPFVPTHTAHHFMEKSPEACHSICWFLNTLSLV